MIYKFSFFVGAAISSFFDNGFDFSWARINKQYKRTMYFNGHIDKLNTDFFKSIASLKEEGILFFTLDNYLDITYEFYLYTRKDFWHFMKLEDSKSNYQRIPIDDTNFEEKMILLENSGAIKKCIVKLQDIPHIIKTKEFKHGDPEELIEFKSYIQTHLFKSKYKAEI
jgi:hypothetical protein